MESNREKSSQIEWFLFLFLLLVVVVSIYDFIFRRIFFYSHSHCNQQISINTIHVTTLSQHRKLAKKSQVSSYLQDSIDNNQYCTVELSIMQKFNSVLLLLFEWRFFSRMSHNVLCQYANVRALKTILHIFFLCTYKSREWQSSFVLVLCVLHIFSHCTICLQYCFFVFYKHETTRKKGTHTHTLVRSLA